MPLRVLVVCTGNVCRSPLAEAALATRLAGSDVVLRSAGTRALVGQPATAETQALARALGADAEVLSRHRSRQLDEALLEGADLVLALAREHRRDVVDLAPAKLRKTLTLREFARLAQVTPDDDVRAAIGESDEVAHRFERALDHIASQRDRVEPPRQNEDDVIDPYRGSQAVYNASGAQILPAVEQVARILKIVIQPPASERAA